MIPYEKATSGMQAREEIRKLLMKFKCTKLGFMDEFDTGTLLLAFEHRGRQIQLRASAHGWAAMYIRENPFSYRRRGTEADYKSKAIKQGMIAVNSILRDWVKGQITAIECGVVSFDEAFMPYMLTNSGETIGEIVQKQKLLPAPNDA